MRRSGRIADSRPSATPTIQPRLKSFTAQCSHRQTTSPRATRLFSMPEPLQRSISGSQSRTRLAATASGRPQSREKTPYEQPIAAPNRIELQVFHTVAVRPKTYDAPVSNSRCARLVAPFERSPMLKANWPCWIRRLA